MASRSTNTTGPKLELRNTGAAAVIVQRVPADKEERFLDLQRGIVAAAKDFAGYQMVDVYPPVGSERSDWVVVIHFDDQPSLERWLSSPLRAEWIAKFRSEFGEATLQQMPTGFGVWFAGLGPNHSLPPRWKVALSVLVTLYPTVMVLAILGIPPRDRLGLSLAMLGGNILSISILQWGLTPALNGLMGPWLAAKGPEGRRVTVLGTLVIFAALAAMTALFWYISG